MAKSLSIIVLGFSLIMSGCGFHLRQHQVQLGHKFPVIVLKRSGSHTFHQALQRALVLASSEVIVNGGKNQDMDAPILSIIAMHTTQQPLVYGPDSELRRERLKMSVTFLFANPTPTEIPLYSVRDRQLNSSQYLGDNAEKSMIEQEMQADIIAQLLQYLESPRF